MPSFVWQREAEEAYSNPYEYDAQAQFSREASAVLLWLEDRVNPRLLRYNVADVSLEKAVWMLRTDAIDSLRESLVLIDERRHRPVGRLFRDALEVGDLAFAFASDGAFAAKHLTAWYANRSPMHRVFRSWYEQRVDTTEASRRQALYADLSKYVHRTYCALLKSYSLGSDDRLVHDRWTPNSLLVLPHTVAAHYAIQGHMIQLLISQLVTTGAISDAQRCQMWEECAPEAPIERRFAFTRMPAHGSG